MDKEKINVKTHIMDKKNGKKQAEQILEVTEELRSYFPLTLRQVYYRLVAAEVIKNNRSRYNDLSKVIKQMRLDKMLPWNVIEDRTAGFQ